MSGCICEQPTESLHGARGIKLDHGHFFLYTLRLAPGPIAQVQAISEFGLQQKNVSILVTPSAIYD